MTKEELREEIRKRVTERVKISEATDAMERQYHEMRYDIACGWMDVKTLDGEIDKLIDKLEVLENG